MGFRPSPTLVHDIIIVPGDTGAALPWPYYNNVAVRECCAAARRRGREITMRIKL